MDLAYGVVGLAIILFCALSGVQSSLMLVDAFVPLRNSCFLSSRGLDDSESELDGFPLELLDL